MFMGQLLVESPQFLRPLHCFSMLLLQFCIALLQLLVELFDLGELFLPGRSAASHNLLVAVDSLNQFLFCLFQPTSPIPYLCFRFCASVRSIAISSGVVACSMRVTTMV